MRRVGLLALCTLLLTQSASWSLEPAFYRPDLHFQVPLEKQFKRI